MKFLIFTFLLVLNSSAYSMEELGHLVKKDRPVRKINLNERLDEICNSFAGNEEHVVQAFIKCQKKITEETASASKLKKQRDACLIQYIAYECALRNQIEYKIVATAAKQD